MSTTSESEVALDLSIRSKSDCAFDEVSGPSVGVEPACTLINIRYSKQ